MASAVAAATVDDGADLSAAPPPGVSAAVGVPLLEGTHLLLSLAKDALAHLTFSPNAAGYEQRAVRAAAQPAAAEEAQITSFIVLAPLSPLEPPPRGAYDGRKLRWVSHGVEAHCPPRPPMAFDFDGVIEDGARGAVGASAAILGPLVQAAFRGVNGCLVAFGQSGAGKSRAIFGGGSYLGGGLGQRAAASILRHAAARLGGEWSLLLSVAYLDGDDTVDLLADAPAGGGGFGPDGFERRPRRPALPLVQFGSDGTAWPMGAGCWPEGLTQLRIFSIEEYETAVGAALAARKTLPPAGASKRSGGGGGQHGHTALVLQLSGTSADGDASPRSSKCGTSRGRRRRRCRRRRPPPPPKPPAPTPPAARARGAKPGAVASSLVTFARVIELLAAPRAQKGAAAGYTSGMVTAAEEEALTSPLTRLLWRAVAGSCVTTTLGFCSASEYDLPATIETCRTAASARTLVTAPTPNRTRPPPTLAAVAAIWARSARLTTLDASAVLRGAADGSAGGEEVPAGGRRIRSSSSSSRTSSRRRAARRRAAARRRRSPCSRASCGT